MRSAVPPFVAQAFAPDSTQLVPSRTARVVSDAASEPDSGSDIENPANSSPRAIALSQRSFCAGLPWRTSIVVGMRSEEHTSELQSRLHLVCRLLLEKKKKRQQHQRTKEHRTNT